MSALRTGPLGLGGLQPTTKFAIALVAAWSAPTRLFSRSARPPRERLQSPWSNEATASASGGRAGERDPGRAAWPAAPATPHTADSSHAPALLAPPIHGDSKLHASRRQHKARMATHPHPQGMPDGGGLSRLGDGAARPETGWPLCMGTYSTAREREREWGSEGT